MTPPSATLTDEQRRSLVEVAAALERDGAAVARGVVSPDWIELMRAAIDAEMAGASLTAAEYGREGGRFYGDFFLWRRNPSFRAFAFYSPLPELAAQMMGSRTVNLLYDQLFVKEPGSVERTPWHQDQPYWPVDGDQIVSVWVPFDPATPDNGVVTYVQGSHLWGATYRPQAFDTRNADAFAASPYQPMPDIEAEPSKYALLSWSLEPGDVLIHKGLTIHGAAGNRTADRRRRALAVRYTGDDARYNTRPGTFMQMASVRANVPAPNLQDGAPVGGPLFPRVRQFDP
ncbi:MAG TPA: phytanoyl-CoA dioxygenase family protein [Caulobacteraceae bacterium]|nr:phytanoyl-CoA dioxygenase family protein [Caulobacteraceae bacterium]